MGRKLHIGGKEPSPEWEIFDALARPGVDHVGNAKDLSRFDDDTFEAVYASHVLEHFDFVDEIPEVVREWFRVLAPGGTIYLSVPDLGVLCSLFISGGEMTADDRFEVMRMIFGGHVDEYDYHLAGLNEEFLGSYLHFAGFANIRRVDEFGLFEDTSIYKFRGAPISLNMTAQKPST